MIPAEILEEARALLLDAATEARRRTGISRAYYATYHHVLHHEVGKDIAYEVAQAQEAAKARGSNAPGLHKVVVEKLIKSKDRSLCNLGKRLKELRDFRVAADYFLAEPVGAKQAADALALAERIFTALPVPV